MKRYLFLFILTLYFLLLKAEHFQYIGLEHGLSQPSVVSISQDGLGRIWLGTYEGINIYDGSSIQTYKGEITNSNNKKLWIGNLITFIKADSNGNIYFISDANLYYYDILTDSFEQITKGNNTTSLSYYNNQIFFTKENKLYTYTHPKENYKCTLPDNAFITSIEAHNDNIYFATTNGAYIYNILKKEFRHLLPGEDVYRIFISHNNEIWIGTKMNGLYRIIKGQIIKVNYSHDGSNGIISSQIREFIEDNNNNIWFGTFCGLQKYNYKTNTYSMIKIPQYASGLNHPSIYALFKDKQGNIWSGSYFGGANYFNPMHKSIIHYDYQMGENSNLYYSYINGMVIDKRHNLWVSTDGGGISCLNKDWKTKQLFTANHKNSIPHNNIKSLCYDEKNDILYIGTHLGGLSKYDIKNKTFFNYLYQYPNNNICPNNVIHHLKKWNDKIIISARNGIFCLNTQNNKFTKLPIEYDLCMFFDITNDGELYYSKNNLLIITNLYNYKSKRIKLFQEGTISNILATDSGAYICTLGKGLFFYNKNTQSLTSYSTKNSNIVSDYCYNIQQSSDKKLILTCDKGIMLFNLDNKNFILLDSKYIKAPIINGCGILTTPDNYIYIGDTKGITLIKESDFELHQSHLEHIFFSKLYINNKHIRPQPKGILTESLAYTNEIKLYSYQNNIQIDLAYPNYLNNRVKLPFEYKLEGFDKEWNKTVTPSIRYTNLKPGTYILYAKIANSRTNNIRLKINIFAPWYNTYWAWFFYISTISVIGYLFIKNKIKQRNLAISLEKERFEKQHIEKLNHDKLVFFTNVSHEFRTPLTLIIGHIDTLLQISPLPSIIYNKIIKIKHNTQHLNNLISELLDFQKFNQNNYLLKVSPLDICAFVRKIYYTFSDYAKQKNIQYEFKADPEKIICYFDSKQIEKVFLNLLSNAFKFTESGNICIKIFIKDQLINISIQDTGKGISQADANHIFDRFYQAQDKNTPIGTGIGLALTKSIIEKHHGNISLTSEIGKGSNFTVTLPMDYSLYFNDKHIQFITSSTNAQINDREQICMIKSSLTETNNSIEQNINLNANNQCTQYKLLIVEDNSELLQILKELFSSSYVVITALNGKEGLDKAIKYKPDIIISDIMMPEMSGTEMCLHIKNNLNLCHIPIILLTALNSINSNIEGLNRGADDYISKPFDSNLLLAKVNNLLRNRLLIQQQINKKSISEIDLTSINPLDQNILRKTSAVIEAHIDDPNFDIPILCKEIGIGRSLLYSKFKSLTGMTPNTFILNQRLKHAALLLKKYPTMPIAEISDRCGFNSPVYFSRCFKNQYKTTPQDYKKQI